MQTVGGFDMNVRILQTRGAIQKIVIVGQLWLELNVIFTRKIQ